MLISPEFRADGCRTLIPSKMCFCWDKIFSFFFVVEYIVLDWKKKLRVCVNCSYTTTMRNQSASFFKTKSKVLLIQTKPATKWKLPCWSLKVPFFFPNKRPWPIFTRHSSYPICSKSLFQHFGGAHKHKALTLLPLHSLSTRLQRALRTSL